MNLSADLTDPRPAPRPVLESHRLERLKQLTLTLLEQVTALRQSVTPEGAVDGFNLNETVRRFEATLIRHALMETDGHQGRAARLLGIKPTTLNEKLKRLEMR